MKLSIIIPAFNESRTIKLILKKIDEVVLIQELKKEIIVIDDFSSDNTVEILNEYCLNNSHQTIRIIKHTYNQGKGAALQTGIQYAKGEIVIIQDADLEYDPNDYNILIKPILEGFADVVYGSRFIGAGPHRVMFFWHSIGNKILTFLSNAMTNLNLTDMETCYKVFKREFIQSLVLREKRFGFEPEVTSKLAKIKGIRIYEVGISYFGRTYEEGKKIGWRDGFRAIYCILKYH